MAYPALHEDTLDEIQRPADGQAEQVAQPEPTEPEKSDPWDLLFSELDTIKARITQLEAIAHSGHNLDENAVAHIASVAIARINEDIRKQLGRLR